MTQQEHHHEVDVKADGVQACGGVVAWFGGGADDERQQGICVGAPQKACCSRGKLESEKPGICEP
jgi:hypothetical protein